jgi:hypothetical protein
MPGRQTIRPCFGHLQDEVGPRHAMHRKPVLIEMEERRRGIELHIPPRRAVARLRKAVRPGVEERDPGGASLRGGGFEVLHAPQNFHAPVAKRGAEHPAAGQEDRLEIARDEGASFSSHGARPSSMSTAGANAWRAVPLRRLPRGQARSRTFSGVP